MTTAELLGADPGWLIAVKGLLVFIICVICTLMAVWAERRVLAKMQLRTGPNRVGKFGLLQSLADGVKLALKEDIIPAAADKIVFIIAPIIATSMCFMAFAVIPMTGVVNLFGHKTALQLTDLPVGVLYILAVTSIGVYGVILAGWSSNSKYPFLGAMRASAQMISYEIAMGFALVTVLLTSGSLNLSSIVASQEQGYFASMGLNFLSWNWLPLLPMFLIYFISGVAETNRHPFDVVEGESEIVAGHMVEYSGMSFAMFFLAEYANMILIAAVASIMFLGGWLPIVDLPILRDIPGFFWLFGKTFFLLSCVIWLRATLPRYRYDQIMRLGWKIFIPISVFWVVVIGAWVVSPWNIWK